jgi:hypothetical protein
MSRHVDTYAESIAKVADSYRALTPIRPPSRPGMPSPVRIAPLRPFLVEETVLASRCDEREEPTPDPARGAETVRPGGES